MKILFGVFNWGLGHATRDIPLIEELIKKNEVYILSTGRALKILREYFYEKCKYYDVPSLFDVYSKKGPFKIIFALSIRKLNKSLKKCRKITEEILKKEKFDKVISDCRYDVYDTSENSYLINHQLRSKVPLGLKRISEIWFASRMKKYKYVIVPDYEERNLSGDLSHNLRYFPKEKIKYIGILSHLKKLNLKNNINYFISLSGPEPTRIELEKKILSQISELDGKITIAGGNPDKNLSNFQKNIKFYSFLNSKKQEEMMNRAKFLIIRSGYTTIMELAELNKIALLIPSPSQTEQEYLADSLKKKNFFHSVKQSKLDLKTDIPKAKKFPGFDPPWKTKKSIQKFMEIVFS